MELHFAKQNWALFAALLVALMVAVTIAMQTLAQTPSNRLRRVRGDLEQERRKFAKAEAFARKAEARVDRLMQKQDAVKPQSLQDARDALQDARALAKIADDRLMVAENQVRKIIHEEFPPRRQEKLRRKYLPERVADSRPFSFGRPGGT